MRRDLGDGYELDDDPARVDRAAVHAYVTRSYWAEGRTREVQDALVDGEAHELDAEAASPVLLEHVHVGEVGLRVPVGERAREADLPAAVVQADDTLRSVDEGVLHLSLIHI